MRYVSGVGARTNKLDRCLLCVTVEVKRSSQCVNTAQMLIIIQGSPQRASLSKRVCFITIKKKNKEFYYTYPSILKLSSTSERSPNTKNSQPKFQQQLTSDTLCRPTTHTARCRNSSWGKWRINAASREPTGQTGQPKRIIQSDHLDSIRSHLKRAILSGGNAAQETVRRRELKRVQQTHASAIGTSSEI